MPLWRRLLGLSAELYETGETQVIDANGMDRIAASQQYAKRANYMFRTVKTTDLIDCKTGVILYIRCSMKQPHDTQIAWQLLIRNLDKLSVLTPDKGYELRPSIRSRSSAAESANSRHIASLPRVP